MERYVHPLWLARVKMGLQYLKKEGWIDGRKEGRNEGRKEGKEKGKKREGGRKKGRKDFSFRSAFHPVCLPSPCSPNFPGS